MDGFYDQLIDVIDGYKVHGKTSHALDQIDALYAEQGKAEVERLRAEVDEWRDLAQRTMAERERETERADDADVRLRSAEHSLAAADRLTQTVEARAEELKEQRDEARRVAETLRASRDEIREKLRQADAERDRLAEQVQRVQLVRAWTNEDGKKFVFADDLRAALHGEGGEPIETRLFSAFADADEQGVSLDGMTVPELTAFVMTAITRGGGRS